MIHHFTLHAQADFTKYDSQPYARHWRVRHTISQGAKEAITATGNHVMLTKPATETLSRMNDVN